MAEGKSLKDHLTVFKEMDPNLKTMEVKYNEEDSR